MHTGGGLTSGPTREVIGELNEMRCPQNLQFDGWHLVTWAASWKSAAVILPMSLLLSIDFFDDMRMLTVVWWKQGRSANETASPLVLGGKRHGGRLIL